MPFEVIPDFSVPQPIDCKFYLRILNSEEFSIYVDEEDVNRYDYSTDMIVSKIRHLDLYDQYRFGEIIQSKNYSFQVVLRNENLKNFEDKEKIVLLTTSGGGDWMPKPAGVDAISSASKSNKVEPLADEIVGKVRKILNTDQHSVN